MLELVQRLPVSEYLDQPFTQDMYIRTHQVDDERPKTTRDAIRG